jgi:hypothetical protein
MCFLTILMATSVANKLIAQSINLQLTKAGWLQFTVRTHHET